MVRNRFHLSVGIVAITIKMEVVLIKRIMPYSLENFIINNDLTLSEQSMLQMKPLFEKNLHKLRYYDRLDYLMFQESGICEDIIDFPHGQIKKKYKDVNIHNLDSNKIFLFRNAHREFCEETGYTFEFTYKDIYTAPMRVLTFKAGDQCIYSQVYFIMRNVTLQPCKKFENQYKTILLNINSARKIFEQLQIIKKDNKLTLLTAT